MSDKKNDKSIKRQKIYRDSIQGITRPAIRRLCRRAQVIRVSKNAYANIRGVMKFYIDDILKDAIVFTEHNRRKTVQASDLKISMETRGIYVGAGLNANTTDTFNTVKSRHRGHKTPTEGSEGVKKKAHRFKPGTVALSEIRYQQKNSDSFALPKTNFRRFVRELGQDYGEEIRYSKGFMELFQLVVEDYLVKLLTFAFMLTLHADRQTLMNEDIDLALTGSKLR